MKKSRIFIIVSVIITVLSVLLRVYTALNMVDPINGKFSSPLWQWLCTAICAVGILAALSCCLLKCVDYVVYENKKKGGDCVFFILGALAFCYVGVNAALNLLANRDVFSMLTLVFSAISVIFCAYCAIRIKNINRDAVYILALGPVAYFIIRLVYIFNVYSKNISLFTYRSEIIGLSAMLLFLIFYTKSALSEDNAKTPFICAQIAFVFLMTFALPKIILMFISAPTFSEGAPLCYAVSDLIFALSALHFGRKILIL